jgi:protein-L-isoaspartate(D-aspartate) O-methyltransferase
MMEQSRKESGMEWEVRAASAEEFSMEECRRFYAEEIRVVAGLTSGALTEAFASVCREQFLGAPPWRYSSGSSLQSAAYHETNQILDLYHDVFVALKNEQFLNNGQPSLLARLLAALDLSAGKRVVHIGCGTGYYSAILAEVVGRAGAVQAVEIDSELAASAAVNLAAYPNVKVFNQDGAAFAPLGVDAILVNAGVTHPHPAWMNGLNDGGVLVIPLLVGRGTASRDAVALRINRRGEQFAAEALTLLTIFPSPTQRDPAVQSQLNACFESYSLLRLRSIRRDAHEREVSCLAHTPGFCLSAEAVNVALPSKPCPASDSGVLSPELVL